MKRTLRVAATILIVLLASAAVNTIPAQSPDSEDPPEGWIGVFIGGGGEVPPEPADGSADPAPRGVRIRAVAEGGPAESARLRGKDLILSVNGTAVSSAESLVKAVRGTKPGASLTLTVLRRGRQMDFSLFAATRPTDFRSVLPITGWIGVSAIFLPASLRAHFGAPEGAGIMISEVVEGSPAEAAGIRVGDVVYEADGESVATIPGLIRALTEAGVDNTIEIALTRDGVPIVVEATIARPPEPEAAQPER